MPCTSLKISSRLKHQASPDTNTRLPGRVLSCHLPSAIWYRPDQGQKSQCGRRGQHHRRPVFPQGRTRAWWLTPTETRQQLTRPSSLISGLQPLTCPFPKDRSGLPRGDVSYFAATDQLDERLDGRPPCTRPDAADADCSTENVTHRTPDACAANPGCPFLERRQRGERCCHGQQVRELAAVQISSRQSRAVCESPRPGAECSTRPPQRIGRGRWSNGGGGNPGGPRCLLSASRPLRMSATHSETAPGIWACVPAS